MFEVQKSILDALNLWATAVAVAAVLIITAVGVIATFGDAKQRKL